MLSIIHTLVSNLFALSVSRLLVETVVLVRGVVTRSKQINRAGHEYVSLVDNILLIVNAHHM